MRMHPAMPLVAVLWTLLVVVHEVPGTVQEVPDTSNSPSDEVPGTSREVPGTSREVPDTSKPPLVVISIDTLRSDRLPAYGYGGVATPAIDRLRRDGVLFRRAYSHVPLTLPSHVSMFTGLLPSVHGVRDNQGYPYSPTADSLPSRLRKLGYATGGAVSAYVLHRRSGFGTIGFDLFDDQVEIEEGQTILGGVDRDGHRTLDVIEPWIRRQKSQPFFLFLHLFEPHLPYTPPELYRERYGNTYEGEIAAADDVVGRLLALLDELGIYDEAWILLLSDHGEGLGDHGEEEHGIFLYREALQVPMILKIPRGRRQGDTVETPVQLVDVYETLLRAAGDLTTDTPHGVPLQEVRDGDPPRPIYAETYYPRLHYGWSELTSLILDRHHLIAGPAPELFDLIDDPAERSNILAKERRRAGELRDQLVALQRPLEAPRPVDEETRQRLAALGYLGSSAVQRDGPLPDPKAKLGTLVDLKLARHHQQNGQIDEAVVAYRRVLEANPGLLDGWQALGDLLHQAGRFEEAAEAFRQATERSGGDADFLAATLAAQIAAGQLDVAVQALATASHLPTAQAGSLKRQLAKAFARRGDFDAALNLLPADAAVDGETQSLRARLLSETGRSEAAAALIRTVVARHQELAVAHEVLGLVALRQNDWEEARAASLRATDLDGERAEAWNQLGVARWYLAEHDDAIEAWRRAVDLDPEAWDTLYNLGTKAMEVQQLDTARDSLKSFIEGAPPDTYGQQLRRAKVLLRRLER